jgi:protein-tyrosine phosphatase
MNPTLTPSLHRVTAPTDDATADHPDRQLHFRGTFNFRDLGGYRARAGQTVRWRTLFRADALHRMDTEELAELQELGVRSVLDLRTQSELDEGRIEADHLNITHFHMPVLGLVWEPEDLDPNADAAKVLGDLYIDMLTVGAPALAAALTTLAQSDRLPAVFHCAAGKDRTGVLAAIVLSLLGVDESIILADYHRTAVSMEALMERLATERPEAWTAMTDQPSPYMKTPPEAMSGFLAHVREHHGSVLGYVRGIGVSAEAIEAINHNLLT